MSRMSRFETNESGFASKTLELFYKTFENLHFTESDIAAMLKKFEQKHGINTQEMAKISSRVNIKLTEEDKKFFKKLSKEKHIMDFCDLVGIHQNFLWSIRKKGYCSQRTYEKLQEAIKQWKEKYAS